VITLELREPKASLDGVMHVTGDGVERDMVIWTEADKE
jgi:hypothetical protein